MQDKKWIFIIVALYTAFITLVMAVFTINTVHATKFEVIKGPLYNIQLASQDFSKIQDNFHLGCLQGQKLATS